MDEADHRGQEQRAHLPLHLLPSLLPGHHHGRSSSPPQCLSGNFVLNLEQRRILKEKRQPGKKEFNVGVEEVTTEKAVGGLCKTKGWFFLMYALMGEGSDDQCELIYFVSLQGIGKSLHT